MSRRVDLKLELRLRVFRDRKNSSTRAGEPTACAESSGSITQLPYKEFHQTKSGVGRQNGDIDRMD
jgi:hypothetical protein